MPPDDTRSVVLLVGGAVIFVVGAALRWAGVAVAHGPGILMAIGLATAFAGLLWLIAKRIR